ncbi:TOBE domain-containing protein, partial [Aeromicrobium sp.]|uniref:TOBE domain-containing protein n=1 Tax=Aeromicrobium sp. TaxID=1871063 RepID=UPI003D6A7D98
HIRMQPPTDGEAGGPGVVIDVQYLGPTTRYRVTLDDGTTLVVEVPNTDASSSAAVGDAVHLSWQRQDRQRVGSATG